MPTVPSLTELTTPSLDDILYLVDNPGGTPADRKATLENIRRAFLPSWSTKILGAYGNCDPESLLAHIQRGGVSATPTNIGTTTARCALFVPPRDITINTIRWYGVAAVSGIYTLAIYRYSTLARLTPQYTITTAANTWGAQVISGGLNLLSGVLYFIACGVNATGTTAGLVCMGGSITATTGAIGIAPQSLPGNLDADLGFLNGYQFQFPVTGGAMPDPAGTPAGQSSWTGGMPAFFLDNA